MGVHSGDGGLEAKETHSRGQSPRDKEDSFREGGPAWGVTG